MEMKHDYYQKKVLPMLRRATSLPENATVAQVVEALLKIDRVEAVELIFATDRSNTFFSKDGLGWNIFMRCMIAEESLILAIAKNHQWSNNNRTKGFAMQVYPGEWLTILEPTATNLLKSMT